MRKYLILTIATLFFSFFTNHSQACTSAIITGKVTANGRPLLWKHRDTGQEQNRIEFFNTGKYTFLALVDATDTGGTAWTGTNSAGFSVMNTASYNLKDDQVKEMDREGKVMYRALEICANLKDFESFLDTLSRPMRVEANFGVIDACGGAAYYEVNNHSWVKIDANDPATAPHGYLVYTNFSYTGRINEGMGYMRYKTASDLFVKKSATSDFTPQWIFTNVSRSFYHSFLGMDLCDPAFSPENASGWFLDQDFIPRKSTSASTVVKGVLPGENPELTVMWSVVGYPPVSVAVPLFVKSTNNLPVQVVARGENSEGLNPKNCEICDLAMDRKASVFPVSRGNGGKYFRFDLLWNREGTGYIQRLAPYEEAIFETFNPVIDKWYKKGSVDLSELSELYLKMDIGAAVK